MEEIWKDVVGFEGYYQVSNKGKLRSIASGKVLSDNADNGAGYMVNGLYKEGQSRHVYRHRIVAEAFIPNSGNLPQVGHKDDNKSNNSVDNLYWCDGSTNIRDAHKSGRMKKRSALTSLEYKDDHIVEWAYRSVKMGMFGVSEAARFFDMPRTTMSSIMNKRSRCKITDKVDEEFA